MAEAGTTQSRKVDFRKKHRDDWEVTQLKNELEQERINRARAEAKLSELEETTAKWLRQKKSMESTMQHLQSTLEIQTKLKSLCATAPRRPNQTVSTQADPLEVMRTSKGIQSTVLQANNFAQATVECVDNETQTLEDIDLKLHLDTSDAGLDPLFRAVRQQNLGEVKRMLDNKSSVEESLPDGSSLLVFATQQLAYDIVEHLIHTGAAVDRVCSQGYTALHCAAGVSDELGAWKLGRMLVEIGSASTIKLMKPAGMMPLHCSILAGHVDLTQFLVQHTTHGANARTGSGDTPLHLAALKNDARLVALLLEVGGSPHLRNSTGRLPRAMAPRNSEARDLLEAALKSHPDVQATDRLLIELGAEVPSVAGLQQAINQGASVEATLPDSRTALMRAVERGRYDLCHALIVAKAQVNRTCEVNGYTALHFAATHPSDVVSVRLLKLLCESKGNPHCITTTTQLKPIHCATLNGNLKAVRFMVEVSGVDTLSGLGDSAYRLAAQASNIPICFLLIYLGAREDAGDDIMRRIPLYQEALNHARAMRYSVQAPRAAAPFRPPTAGGEGGEGLQVWFKLRSALLDPSRTGHMQEKGSDMVRDFQNLKTWKLLDYTSTVTRGRTLMHEAALSGNQSCLKLLGKAKAKITRDEDGVNPLHDVCRGNMDGTPGALASLKLLIKMADKDFLNQHTHNLGLTPLHIATLHDNFFAMIELLKAGADVDVRTIFGHSALHLAVFTHSPEATKILLHGGINAKIKDQMSMTASELTMAYLTPLQGKQAQTDTTPDEEAASELDEPLPPKVGAFARRGGIFAGVKE